MKVAVIGAGPAGLVAAREALRHGCDVTVGFMVDANSPGGGWGFIVSKPGAADCGFGLMRLPPMNTDAGKAMLSLMLSAQATQNKLPEIAYSASATVNAVCQITSAQIDSGA